MIGAGGGRLCVVAQRGIHCLCGGTGWAWVEGYGRDGEHRQRRCRGGVKLVCSLVGNDLIGTDG